MSTLIIAEAGVNHDGALETAKKLIEVAADAGADMVKFQTFVAEKNISPNAVKAQYQQRNTGNEEGQLEMVRKLQLGREDHFELLEHCREYSIGFLSTPFDDDSIRLLQELGVQHGKIPSGEVTNLPYLRRMASAFPSLIMSTGMCDMGEIKAALDALYEAGASADRMVVLHCNTQYPTPMQDVNLHAMQSIAKQFNVAVGYSDHTLGIEVPIAAVAMGATVIEKHFTLDQNMPGPDHKASLEPEELKAMVTTIRNIEQALGSKEKAPTPSELENRPIARKSVHLAKALDTGEVLTEEHLIMLRPGTGISPMQSGRLIGMRTRRPLEKWHQLTLEDLE